MTIWWRGVQLEVARIYHAADRSLDRKRDRVRDRVTDRHCFDAKRSHLHAVADAHLTQVRLAQDAMLFQLRLDQPQREPRPVDRHVELLEDEGQAADMVLVSVAEKDAEHVAPPIQEVRDVRQHEVDSQHLLLRKHEPGVDHKDLVLPFEGPHVDADLPEAAEWQIPEPGCAHKRRSCSASCLGTGGGSGGGGGASSLSRYAFTLSKSFSRSATRAPLWRAAAG